MCPVVPYQDFGPLVRDHQVYRMDEAPLRLERIASLEEHDDMVTCVAPAGVHRRLVLSGSWDKRYDVTSSNISSHGRIFEVARSWSYK